MDQVQIRQSGLQPEMDNQMTWLRRT